ASPAPPVWVAQLDSAGGTEVVPGLEVVPGSRGGSPAERGLGASACLPPRREASWAMRSTPAWGRWRWGHGGHGTPAGVSQSGRNSGSVPRRPAEQQHRQHKRLLLMSCPPPSPPPPPPPEALLSSCLPPVRLAQAWVEV